MRLIPSFALLALTACATTFTGSAKVERGRAGCEDVCRRWQMELAGMIQMGEYSDGCICRVRELLGVEEAAQAGTVAVEMAKRRRDAAAAMAGPGLPGTVR